MRAAEPAVVLGVSKAQIRRITGTEAAFLAMPAVDLTKQVNGTNIGSTAPPAGFTGLIAGEITDAGLAGGTAHSSA